jgi:hypothetical protein
MRPEGKRIDMSGRNRDDLFTMIHKALRAGLLMLDIEAGRIDWGDATQVEAFARRWDQIATLTRSHAGHEERHIWPLLESKQPGAVAELGVGHDPIDAELDDVDALLATVVADPTPTGGLTFYRALNRLMAHLLDHFAAEEPAVMEMLWALCTDEELAAAHSALMSEIPPHEAAWSFELILRWTTDEEQRAVVRELRSSMPAPVFADWIDGAERTLPPEAFQQLRRLLDEPVPVG